MLISCQIIANICGVYYVPRISRDMILVNPYNNFMGLSIILYEIASAIFPI